MHSDEVNTEKSIVERLLAGQFPEWTDLPLEAIESAGTDNAIYRLGNDMAVRLPRIHWAVEQVNKEQEWLPKLAPYLPLAISKPIARGAPGEGYPWNWSIYEWLPGENAVVAPISDLCREATEIAGFISALQRIDTADGPPPGEHNFFRGVPLASRDTKTREAISSLQKLIATKTLIETDTPVEADALIKAWGAAIDAPDFKGSPAWIHGDLQAGNLLVERGRVSSVIDFGGLGVGDPACDLMIAWTLFSGESRNVFRAAMSVDDATWARGRGWALSVALVALPYYLETNPVIVRTAKHAINEVLADHIL